MYDRGAKGNENKHNAEKRKRPELNLKQLILVFLFSSFTTQCAHDEVIHNFPFILSQAPQALAALQRL